MLKHRINLPGILLWFRTTFLISILICNLWNWAHLFFELFSCPPSCVVCAPYIILFMPKSPSPFIKTRLFLLYSFPSSQILPVKKHRRENERQRWRRAKSLRGEGPIKRAPFSSKECAQRWREMKEVKEGKKTMLSILSKDRFLLLL